MFSVTRTAVSTSRRCFTSSTPLLSGHNKWSKIKERKGKEDQKKSAIYGKANRDILVAAKTGGSADPELNPTLANIVKLAKSSGVPKDVLDRALTRAKGEKGKGSNSVTYEAMAHGSVGVMIECLTDNLKRTSGLIQEILSDHNGRFTPSRFLFQHRGLVSLTTSEPDDRIEHLLEEALAEADDFEQEDERDSNGVQNIHLNCPPQSLAALTALVRSSSVSSDIVTSELVWSPVEPADADDTLREKVASLVEDLEENEDCMRVWTTLD